MESLLDHFSGLRFVTTRHTGAFFPSSLSFNLGVQSYFFSFPFRATISSQLWHSKSSFSFIVWHSEPPFLHSYGVQSRRSRSQFGIQIHWSVQVFRAIFPSLGVQSHFPQFRHSKPFLLVQAFRPIFLNQVFRATLLSLGIQTHLPQLGVQSHFYQLRHTEPPSSIQAFRATLFSLGVQSYLAQLGVHSHLSQLGVQSHFLNQAFRVTSLAQAFKVTSLIELFRAIFSNFRRLDPLLLVQVFKAIFFNLSVQSHLFQFRHSEPHSSVRRSEPPTFAVQAFKAIVQAFRATFFS